MNMHYEIARIILQLSTLDTKIDAICDLSSEITNKEDGKKIISGGVVLGEAMTVKESADLIYKIAQSILDTEEIK